MNSREYYLQHKEKICAASRLRHSRLSQDPSYKAGRRKYYLRHKKRILKEFSERYKKDPAKYRARSKRRYLRAKTSRGTPRRRAQIIYTACRTRAKARGFECDLTREWVQERIEKGVCALSGARFELELDESGRPRSHAPSIDRIDNTKGYLQSNCRIILWCLNLALNVWGESVMLPLWRAVLENREKLK